LCRRSSPKRESTLSIAAKKANSRFLTECY
jgi:hypothetical protein